MTVAEFRAAVDAGKIKHMGLRESLLMVGNGLGVDSSRSATRKIDPIVAEREVVTQYLKVAPGQGPACIQTIDGRGRINVRLELRMYVGAEDVAPTGNREGRSRSGEEIKGGVHGDATAAMVVIRFARDQRAAGCVDHGRQSISFR